LRRSRTEATAYAGILGSAVAVALVDASPAPWLALLGALLLASVPAGAAVMCRIDSGDGVAQAGLTLVISLAVFALASAAMIWVAWWHPRALLTLAGLSVISCTLRLARGAQR
jgi:hypothetical protein